MSLDSDEAGEESQALKSSILGFRSQLIVVVMYSALSHHGLICEEGERESSLEGLLERLNM